MNPGPRYWDGAELMVMPVADLPAHIARAMRQVVGVKVPIHLRHMKRATHLMQEVIREADTHGIALMVHPMPFGESGMDSAALEAWYGRMGFQELQREPMLLMVRRARTH